MFSPASFAADVVIITDSRHPVRTMGGEQPIELDEAPRIEAELSAALPADPGQATAIVKRRLSQGALTSSVASPPNTRALPTHGASGITTIPAVVVDQRYVVYGEPDVPAPSRAHRTAPEGQP